MNIRPDRKKAVWQRYLGVGFCTVIGAVCGVVIGMAIVRYVKTFGEKSIGQQLTALGVLLVGMYLAVFLNIIIHEAGHLVFGRLSGYQFSSFRIGRLMWIKEEGKIRLKKLSIAGTGGQCLMSPPDMADGGIPVVLYNLGGSLMNAVSGFICLGLCFVTGSIPYVPVFFAMMAVIGMLDALSNAIPMRMGMVDNDGYNALALRRDKEAQRSFWIQLKANNELARGRSILEQPAEWFEMPSDEGLKNSMVAVMGVFACNRLMSEHRFEEAAKEMEKLLEKDTAIVDLHRNLLICDLIYCELIGENRRERLEELLDKEQRKFMKSMRRFPAVLRTEYAYALLGKKDEQEADKIREQFERAALTYPYPKDAESEREFMDIVKNREV